MSFSAPAQSVQSLRRCPKGHSRVAVAVFDGFIKESNPFRQFLFQKPGRGGEVSSARHLLLLNLLLSQSRIYQAEGRAQVQKQEKVTHNVKNTRKTPVGRVKPLKFYPSNMSDIRVFAFERDVRHALGQMRGRDKGL